MKKQMFFVCLLTGVFLQQALGMDTIPDRDVYLPGTARLGPPELRTPVRPAPEELSLSVCRLIVRCVKRGIFLAPLLLRQQIKVVLHGGVKDIDDLKTRTSGFGDSPL